MQKKINITATLQEVAETGKPWLAKIAGRNSVTTLGSLRSRISDLALPLKVTVSDNNTMAMVTRRND